MRHMSHISTHCDPTRHSTYYKKIINGENSDSGMVPTSNKPLPVSVLTYILSVSPYSLTCVGVGGFFKVGATFNHVGGSFNLFMATTGSVWIIPSFSNLGLCAVCWAHFMCHHKLWPSQHQWATPALFSIALEALLVENITRELLSLSLDLFLKNLLFQVTFLIFFFIAVFSPYFLMVGLLLQCMALFQARELVMV